MSEQHPNRPHWNPEYNWGTVFTVLGGIFVAGIAWAGLDGRLAQTESHMATSDARISRMETRLDDRLSRIEDKVDRL